MICDPVSNELVFQFCVLALGFLAFVVWRFTR